MFKTNGESEYKQQEFSAEFEAALDNAISQLSKFILAQSAINQIEALTRLGSEIMSMQTQTVRLLSQCNGRLAEVCTLAETVFEENGANWLFTPNWALNWAAPAEMLNSEEGIQEVID